MNWLQKTSQSKPMLPFARPENFERGLELIDKVMEPEVADEERMRLRPGYLGSGGMGLAGLTSGGLVVKYTQDKDEAAIAEAFMGKKTPCLPMVHDVRELQDSLWAITMEKVKTLPPKREIYWMITYLSNMLYEPQEDFDEHLKSFSKIVLEFPYLRKIADDYNKMIECLESNNIVPGDAHSGNVGYNTNGSMVLFDLGLSNLREFNQ